MWWSDIADKDGFWDLDDEYPSAPIPPPPSVPEKSKKRKLVEKKESISSGLSSVGIQLPVVVTYTAEDFYDERLLNNTTIWGILMTCFIDTSNEKRTSYHGSVFIPINQNAKIPVAQGVAQSYWTLPPSMMGFMAMWEWARNTDNVPLKLRYTTLSGPLKGLEGKKKYLQPSKCWKIPELGMNLEQINRYKIPIYPYFNDLTEEDFLPMMNGGTTSEISSQIPLTQKSFSQKVSQ